MTFSHSLRQRLTACIAIVAVLLLFVAPIVSKTLMERQSQMANMPQHSMMSESHHAMMMDMSMPGMSHHMMEDGEFACGYCDLLVHVPLMFWVFIPLIWLVMVISRAPPLPRVTAPIIRRYSGTHRPRAPPARLSC